MKDYVREVFGDTLLSLVTKKYGTSLSDSQKEAKVEEIITQLHDENKFTIEMTQSLIDKKGFNDFSNANVKGQSVYMLVKTGLFGKVKTCYFITRSKDTIDGAYLEKVYDELNRQASGENVFGSSDYANKG